MGSQVRTAGGAEAPAGPAAAGLGEQVEMRRELIESMTRDAPSIDHMLTVIHARLGGCAGLLGSSVFTMDAEEGLLDRVGGRGEAEDDHLKLAGDMLRTPAGGPPLRPAGRLVTRLRMGGQTVGALVLSGTALEVVQADVVSAMALSLSMTVAALAAERSRQFVTHATDVIRTLFEEGTVAGSVEAAGTLLARMTARAFRTGHAAVHLVDGHGRIKYATSISLSPERDAELRDRLIGKIAAESPVWQAIVAEGGPLLVDDVGRSAVRPGGFVQTMGLRSYIAMPLMSAGGAVGMVVCGDASARHWTGADRLLARQLSVEGALIVDSARLRDAEAQHVAELTRRAYHDPLTGLPNRAQLLLTANRAVAAAVRAGRRTALLLLDLDGFKGVNDTFGHHAGDLLLQQVSERLLDAVRDNDMVARLGGDEFAVLLTRDPGEQAATQIAERVHRLLIEPYPIDGDLITIGASIGIALCPNDATDVATLLRGADAAMYRAKRHGGGCRAFISS